MRIAWYLQYDKKFTPQNCYCNERKNNPKDKCCEEQFEGQSAAAKAISKYITEECYTVQNRKKSL